MFRDKEESKRKSGFGRWGREDLEEAGCSYIVELLVSGGFLDVSSGQLNIQDKQESAGLELADVGILGIDELAQRVQRLKRGEGGR